MDSLKLGVIADLFMGSNDGITSAALIAFALEHFQHEGLKLVCTATSSGAVDKLLKAAGFFTLGREQPMIYPNSQAAREAAESSRYLGKSDCDWGASPLREKSAPG